MDARFRKLVDTLEPTFRKLVEMPPVRFGALPRTMPEQGLYLFSERRRHLYVGRTDRLRRRLQDHCRDSSNHFKATFAFRIARVETGRTKAAYVAAGSRGNLEQDPVFGPAFSRAKSRLRSMDLRFVEEPDPTRQALLEIYTATVLKTPYNDFENH